MLRGTFKRRLDFNKLRGEQVSIYKPVLGFRTGNAAEQLCETLDRNVKKTKHTYQ